MPAALITPVVQDRLILKGIILCKQGEIFPPFGLWRARTTEGARCFPVFARLSRRDTYRNGVMKHPHR